MATRQGVISMFVRRILPRPPSPLTTQLLADTAVVTLGWTAVLIFSNITETFKRSDGLSLVLIATGTVVTLAIMERRGLYAGRPALPRTEEISAVFVASLGGASAITVLAAMGHWHIGAWEILVGFIVVFSARTLARGLLRALAAEIPDLSPAEKVVIVGTGEEARELANLIVDHPESRLVLAGVVGNLAVAERSGLIDYWIGPAGRLIELMHQHEITGAIVTATGFRGEQFRVITRELFDAGYDVHLTTGVSRLGQGRFDVRSLSHEPLVVMARNSISRSHLVIKRGIDILLASLAITIFAPVMIAVSVAIWLNDRGPVTYTSSRVGRRGELFPMFKFRSMVINADALKAQMAGGNERTGPLFKITNDPRITFVGRIIRETSLDELPQLFNVLRGDMSLVGPRPCLPEEQAVFDEELKDRSIVRPGITGLWQVEARSNASFNAYRRLDLHYVENWSLALDLRILLATAEQVLVSLTLMPLRLLRRGAGNDGVVTATGTPVPSLNSLSPLNARTGPGIGIGDGNGLAVAAENVPTPASGKMSDEQDVVIDLRRRSRARMAALDSEAPIAFEQQASGSNRSGDR